MPVQLCYIAGTGHRRDNAARWPAGERDSAHRGLVLVGTKEYVKKYIEHGGVENLLEAGYDSKVLLTAIDSASVSDYSGGSFSSISATNGNGICTLQCLLIPSKASRHNSAARADVLSKLSETIRQGGSDGILKSDVVICVSDNDAAFALGCALARGFPKFAKKRGSSDAIHTVLCVSFWNANTNSAVDDAKLLEQIAVTAEGIRNAARLVDMPCNLLGTTEFVEEVLTATKGMKNVKVEVIKGEELKDKGFGGIYNVGKGAVRQPAMCVMTYDGGAATEKVCWVGKGIVFDTGGIQLKPKDGITSMKCDMGGAAAIFQAFLCVAKLAPANMHLTAILCLAENAIGSRALLPDDIITLYSGKTVEINNTDAEGRLVLSDGVAYATQVIKPQIVLDMATLTGAQGIATGKLHAAIMTNDDDIERQCIDAGKKSGDMTHPLLYAPELLMQEFSSAVADMKNSVRNRANAQSSCAAMFIASNLADDFTGKWLHVDIASPAKIGERATGFGVALLVQLFMR